MKIRDVFLLFLLAALWGMSFLFIKIAVPVLGPFPLVACRVTIGGIVLFVYAVIIGRSPDWRINWHRYLLIGFFNNAVPFTLIATAQLNLTSSLAALLNAVTPLFSAVIAAIWIKDKLTIPKLIGLFLGIVGVGFIVGWESSNVDQTRLLSIILMLGATLSYGFSAVYSKVAFKAVNPVSTSTGQLLSASIMILPIAFLNPPQAEIQSNVIWAVLGLAVLSTSAAYLIYFHLIESAGPTPAASVTLLIPFFSSLWGAIFLAESLTSNEIIGFAIILVSLLLVTGLWKQIAGITKIHRTLDAA